MFAGDISVVTGLVATDVGDVPSADAGCDWPWESVEARSEASFPQPVWRTSVASSEQTAKNLAKVGMVDIQESFRGFLNDFGDFNQNVLLGRDCAGFFQVGQDQPKTWVLAGESTGLLPSFYQFLRSLSDLIA